MKKYLRVPLLAVVCFAAFFVHNEVIVPDIMETRNIVTAREMVYDGHWLVPTLNGEFRLQKPPLPTWIAALAEMISADNIALQRAMAGLAAVLLVVYFYRFSKNILHLPPMIPTLLLCTCYNIILMGRTASWDIYCHAFMMAGIYYFARGILQKKTAWKEMSAAGLFIGLSIMSKGPVSLYALFVPFLLSFFLLSRWNMKSKGLSAVAMILIALLVGTWWYVYIYTTHEEDLVRIAAEESKAWLNHNVRPWWYYWKFFLESGIWSLLLLTAIVEPFLHRSCRNRGYWFVLLWMGWILVLLSALPEKKPRYLLPILIPCCYVMGYLLQYWFKRFTSKRADKVDVVVFRFNSVLLSLAVFAVPISSYIYVFRKEDMSFTVWFLSTLFFLAVAINLIYSSIKCNVRRMLGSVVILFVGAECFALPYVDGLVNNTEVHSISATRSLAELDDKDFYHNASDGLRIELVYEAGRKIRPLDFSDIDSVLKAMPCVLLTHRPVEEELDSGIIDSVVLTPIDRYDDNRRPKGNRRYSKDFIYYATLISSKADVSEKVGEE